MQVVEKVGDAEWGLVLGGSDGLGEAYAEALAAKGMNLILVGRRATRLTEVATRLHQEHGVEVRGLPLDLGEAGAAATLDAATAELAVATVVFNAGADASGSYFLDAPVETWRSLIERNIVFLTEALHRFGSRLRTRGAGRIIVVGSEAAFGGGAGVAAYSATKAFALALCESLWAELRPFGVDVQILLFGIADTPTLRNVLARHQIPVEAVGATAPADLARASLATIGEPVLNFDEPESDSPLTSARHRRARVESVTERMKAFRGPD